MASCESASGVLATLTQAELDVLRDEMLPLRAPLANLRARWEGLGLRQLALDAHSARRSLGHFCGDIEAEYQRRAQGGAIVGRPRTG